MSQSRQRHCKNLFNHIFISMTMDWHQIKQDSALGLLILELSRIRQNLLEHLCTLRLKWFKKGNPIGLNPYKSSKQCRYFTNNIHIHKLHTCRVMPS